MIVEATRDKEEEEELLLRWVARSEDVLDVTEEDGDFIVEHNDINIVIHQHKAWLRKHKWIQWR